MAREAAIRAGAGYATVAVPGRPRADLRDEADRGDVDRLSERRTAASRAGGRRARSSRPPSARPRVVLGPGLGRAERLAALVARAGAADRGAAGDRRRRARTRSPAGLELLAERTRADRADAARGRARPAARTRARTEIAAHRLWRAPARRRGAAARVVVLKGDDTIVVPTASAGGQRGSTARRWRRPAPATSSPGMIARADRARASSRFAAPPAPPSSPTPAPAASPAERVGAAESVIADDVIAALPAGLGGAERERRPRVARAADGAIVDLGAVERNCARLAAELARERELCAVVKADGYGHGAVECAAGGAARAGRRWLGGRRRGRGGRAAAALPEAPAARDGRADRGRARRRARRRRRRRGLAAGVPRAGRGARPARSASGPRVHVKYDSGMGRLGERDPDAVADAGRRSCGRRAGRAGRLLDPLRDRRRARLRVLRRAARALPRGRRAARASAPGLLAARRQQRRDAARARAPLRHGPLRDRGLRPRPVPGATRCARARAGARAALLRRRRQALRARATAPATAGAGARPRTTWVGVLPIGYGDGVRRGLTNNARGPGRRPPLPAGRHDLDGQHHDRPRPRDRRRARRAGGADRRPGRRADPRRGGRAAPGDDQLRDHLRDLAAGPAGSTCERGERRRSQSARRPPGRRARPRRRSRDGDDAPGSSAARSATRSLGRRRRRRRPRRRRRRARRRPRDRRRGGRATRSSSPRSSRPGGRWRRDGGWHVDVSRAARRSRSRPTSACATSPSTRSRSRSRPAADRSTPPAGSPTSRRGCCAPSPSAASPTTRCGSCAPPGSPPGSSSSSSRRRSQLARARGRAGRRAGRRAPVRRAAPAARRRRTRSRGLELLDELGATAAVLPELEALRGVEQNPNHHLDVHGHTIEVLRAAARGRGRPRRRFAGDAAPAVASSSPSRSPTSSPAATRCASAALLHDIGKPATRASARAAASRFIGHDRVGARDRRRALRAAAGEPAASPTTSRR